MQYTSEDPLNGEILIKYQNPYDVETLADSLLRAWSGERLKYEMNSKGVTLFAGVPQKPATQRF